MTRQNLNGLSAHWDDVRDTRLHGNLIKLALFRVTQPFCTNVPDISPDLTLSPDLQICISRSTDLYRYTVSHLHTPWESHTYTPRNSQQGAEGPQHTSKSSLQYSLSAELDELQSLSQEVPGLVARTRELGRFVNGLKPEAANPVVCKQDQHDTLCVIEANWQSVDNQVREELATTQTLAKELKAIVDELMALKGNVEAISARVSASGVSP